MSSSLRGASPVGETIWILGDQLLLGNAGLARADRSSAVVLMMETRARGKLLRYHKKKNVLIVSAMRHFAEELREGGWVVDYHRLEDTADFEEGWRRHLEAFAPQRVRMAEPNSFIETEVVQKLARKLGLVLELLPTTQFLSGREEFRQWAGASTRLLMENHYRRMRKKTGYLMQPDGEPVGKRWNFDEENRLTVREFAKAKVGVPPLLTVEPDAITREVMQAVEEQFPHHYGSTEGFWIPVTRQGAREWLAHFVSQRLGRFGDFEDLMIEGEPALFHSALSPLLNIGLLTPQECVEAAIAAYEGGLAPLNAVEGFVRQVIGWREFINGVYWLRGPEYKALNGLGAERALPEWFYTGETPMNCLHQVISQVLEMGWNHHIQRLMVLGNFFLLAEIRPQEALRWFLEMYVDAFDWVMAANVIGMICHADGGYMATKPYAASGAYIHRMSNYCEGCQFKPEVKSGPGACPFNLLYWNFFDRHAERFGKNPRTKMPVSAWLKRAPVDRERIVKEAHAFLDEHVPQ